MPLPSAFCFTSRTATLIAGVIDVVIGLTGLSLMMLDTRGRHMMLDPLVVPLEGESFRYDYIKDSYQFLIEYLLPSVSLFLLGIVLITASVTKISCLVISSFVFSTIMIAGSVACLFCLLLSGAHWAGLMPYLVVTILQCIFYVVVVDFSRYAWDFKETEDKEMLVITTKALSIRTWSKMYEVDGGGGACPCLRPVFGAIAVGIFKLFTGPLSMLGLYWTVFIFLQGGTLSKEQFDADSYRLNSRDYRPHIKNDYVDVLKIIFYIFSVPAVLPVVSGILVFVAIIQKSTKYLRWALLVNLGFILSCIIVIVLICALGIKFLATLPLLALLMLHTYFLVVISLFKEWVELSKYFSRQKNPPSTTNGKAKHVNGLESTLDEPDAPPPPIPPRVVSKAASRSNGNYYNISDIIQPRPSTRSVTVTSV